MDAIVTDCFRIKSASYGGLGDWKQAAADAKECIRLDPSFIKGYYRLAIALQELADHDGAMSTVRQGLTVDKNNAQLQKQLRTIKQLKKAADNVSNKKAANSATAAPSTLPGGAPLDATASRELQDLQVQYTTTTKELQTVQANLVKAQREFKVANITKSELDEISSKKKDDQVLYRSIGKMFLLQSHDAISSHLDQQMSQLKKDEKHCTQKMEYLERRLKSFRTNMEELVANARSR